MSDSRPLLPPRLKDWTKGKTQIGVFVRTREGSTVQATHPDASDFEMKLLLAIGVGTARKMAANLKHEILVELEQITKEKR